ncbi:hypothetical protein OHB02_12025 [Streptomyces albidoflavus]|nr:hypothetical protein [Streptomyces sp. OUCMDZ-3434]WDV32600.1 hypothetical protein OIM90_18790 [Streptomyces sp. AD16]WSB20901.1 hypothetical protein OHB02_12025 [Streptomyces albidoflavus]
MARRAAEPITETRDLHPTHRHADWLDRPLAFTFALIGDTPPLTG